MRAREAAGHVRSECGYLRGGDRTVLHQLVERLTIEELHHEERRAVFGLVVVEHAHRARVLDRVRDVALAQKPRARLAVHAELRCDARELGSASDPRQERHQGVAPETFPMDFPADRSEDS